VPDRVPLPSFCFFVLLLWDIWIHLVFVLTSLLPDPEVGADPSRDPDLDPVVPDPVPSPSRGPSLAGRVRLSQSPGPSLVTNVPSDVLSVQE
jgi:hypothetical protein